MIAQNAGAEASIVVGKVLDAETLLRELASQFSQG